MYKMKDQNGDKSANPTVVGLDDVSEYFRGDALTPVADGRLGATVRSVGVGSTRLPSSSGRTAGLVEIRFSGDISCIPPVDAGGDGMVSTRNAAEASRPSNCWTGAVWQSKAACRAVATRPTTAPMAARTSAFSCMRSWS